MQIKMFKGTNRDTERGVNRFLEENKDIVI